MLFDIMLEGRLPYLFAVLAGVGGVLSILLCNTYGRWTRQLLREKSRGGRRYKKIKEGFEEHIRKWGNPPDIGLYVKNQMEQGRLLFVRMRTWERAANSFPRLIAGAGIFFALYASSQHFTTADCFEILGHGMLAGLACYVIEQLFHVGGSRYRMEIGYMEHFANVLRPALASVQRTNGKEVAEYAALTEQASLQGVGIDSEPIGESMKEDIRLAADKILAEVPGVREPLVTGTEELEMQSIAIVEQEQSQVEEQRMEQQKRIEEQQEQERQLRLEEIRLRQEKRKQERLAKEEKARLELEAKAEKERRHQLQKLEQRRRKEEQRVREKQAALQAVYEEKQRKLREKFLGKMKDECAVSAEAAYAGDADFIEDVLKEFFP